MNPALRQLPAVHEVLTALTDVAPEALRRPELAAHCIREELQAVRGQLKEGAAAATVPNARQLAERAAERLQAELRPRLQGVVNATGILLHTNLGRAPLAEAAARAAYDVARDYCNLEMDLETGARSSRQAVVREWLVRLLGSPSATVVNNNAAATVLALRALAQGREVIVSRGQLVEIGGSFRIPEIMAVSGAILREVGTTNITRLADYEAALTERTAALLRVHASNYRVVGHAEVPGIGELVALARARGLLVIDDVGSGALVDFGRWQLADEPLPRESLAAGADLVLFSGDKLLGGPQAGILAGKKELIERIEKDPLMRAFRVDKMTLAALEATLRLYFEEADLTTAVPLLRMVDLGSADLRRRAARLAEGLEERAGVRAEVVETTAYVGGGSLPNQGLSSIGVACRSTAVAPNELARRLRLGAPPVVARVADEVLLFDLRTVFPEQDDDVLQAVRRAVTLPQG
jgi:L-seryl-tRNA(Ser) seleniumtransferase